MLFAAAGLRYTLFSHLFFCFDLPFACLSAPPWLGDCATPAGAAPPLQGRSYPGERRLTFKSHCTFTTPQAIPLLPDTPCLYRIVSPSQDAVFSVQILFILHFFFTLSVDDSCSPVFRPSELIKTRTMPDSCRVDRFIQGHPPFPFPVRSDDPGVIPRFPLLLPPCLPCLCLLRPSPALPPPFPAVPCPALFLGLPFPLPSLVMMSILNRSLEFQPRPSTSAGARSSSSMVRS